MNSAGITTPGLIGFVLFIILYFPIIYFVPAWKVQKWLEVQVVVATATLLGIMGWAIAVSSASCFPMDLINLTCRLVKWRKPRQFTGTCDQTYQS